MSIFFCFECENKCSTSQLNCCSDEKCVELQLYYCKDCSVQCDSCLRHYCIVHSSENINDNLKCSSKECIEKKLKMCIKCCHACKDCASFYCHTHIHERLKHDNLCDIQDCKKCTINICYKCERYICEDHQCYLKCNYCDSNDFYSSLSNNSESNMFKCSSERKSICSERTKECLGGMYFCLDEKECSEYIKLNKIINI